MKNLTSITKALADESRLRILAVLRGGELCVCQVQECLQLAPSTVSKHLALLAQAGLVESRREGRWAWYRLADSSETTPEAAAALDWVLDALTRENRVKLDDATLKAIRRFTPEELVTMQARGIPCCTPANAIKAGGRRLLGALGHRQKKKQGSR